MLCVSGGFLVRGYSHDIAWKTLLYYAKRMVSEELPPNPVHPEEGRKPEAQFEPWQTETFQISGEDVEAFAKLTGDYNTLHFENPETAPVHGMLIFGKISGIFTKVFGNGTKLLKLTTTLFGKPVLRGETVSVEIGKPEPTGHKGMYEVQVKATKLENGRKKSIFSNSVTLIPPPETAAQFAPPQTPETTS